MQQNGGAAMHQEQEETATLADVSQIGDSPMLRAMGSEVVDIEVHDGLAAIALYEQSLDQRSWPLNR
ncbi:hypothetical protein C6A85_000000105325 [Mycobacterium sp. ITM-2017-0098]|nr:hypothetical protein C6A85_000000105325 [Mycobacterium sp. ITM-2017-0098]